MLQAMSQPFQCLYKRPEKNQGEYDILAAASGSCICCFDVVSGNLVSVWTSQQGPDNSLKKAADAKIEETNDAISNGPANIGSARPSKRQKVSSLGEGSGTSTGPLLENEYDLEAESSTALQNFSAIIKLTGTRDGRYLIAVTDDKCIRVLEFQQDDILKQLSERYSLADESLNQNPAANFWQRLMPKRPCAISLTPDENIILCADKFGDVYSLPLLEISNEGSSTAGSETCRISLKQDEASAKPFTPAANTKTVHTLRNRRALRDQQNHAKIVPKMKSSNFEHHLLLGHVSMLTDLLCMSIFDDTSIPPQPRTYIFTSDRDEHIRVSRGIPQAHIIEGFCLGHTEFVSKLCIPHWSQKILISGGGDDYFLTWNWLSGEILQKVDLKSHVDGFRRHYISASDRLRTNAVQDLSEHGENHFASIAVSGIWAVQGLGANIGDLGGEVVVACEG